MAGNSQRRGATRKSGKKPTVGSGGQRRRGLEGKGPTPKAEDRTYHSAHKKKVAAQKRASTTTRRPASGKGRGAVTEVVAGRNSVVEAMRAGIPVSTVYIATRLESDDRTREILRTAADEGYPLLEVTKPELDRMTDGAVHQGVAIQVPPYDYADVEDLLDIAAASDRPPLIVALDGVTDPRNLGAVLRSAGAFGAHGVLVPERRSAGVTASAWKVSAGAAARVPVARATNLVRALERLHEAGCFIVGLDGGGSTTVADMPYSTDPLVLVIGSEGKGLSRLVAEHCDVIASIPIASEVESLNAGVAGGIALYEVARQRSL
ncbi:23S rRNA (guanosine(2251)-2'-O)-methyltransferase RlmB [Cellulomonas denverensis]|uniref:23S rRNA (Guanosine(2251)-2'-O)-methyltransferase RlmB n=1 Tax=Cellulomonas denverensis TaxID=264297 RepID=A0A7X6KVA9_9CELL|nr:23S rRNA (guanosine(2251)-2'-O)-methyltransferase RlmB [Cellulomonas denverensis]NKY22922.1 23S rRNA (guanosine(2251)-2'-O)-methyltransferase RlmB [Cellulomonas denverensis]GIG24004.1 23S rRNA (guanosine(2251)-2'-O)-methyltransferase RlmB [Cellulomonas denverensis]